MQTNRPWKWTVPQVLLHIEREDTVISREANLVKRHSNPIGIFSRVVIYPMIGIGAWRHRLH